MKKKEAKIELGDIVSIKDQPFDINHNRYIVTGIHPTNGNVMLINVFKDTMDDEETLPQETKLTNISLIRKGHKNN